MSKLGDYILGIKNKFSKETQNIKRETLNYVDTKYIGILFNIKNESHHQALNDFVHQLEKDGKKVSALAYFEREGSNPYDFKFEFFRKKDISSLGTIKSEQVDNFASMRFDYLYCINIDPFPAFDNILLHSQAKCRIGKFFENKINYFDFMLHLKDEGQEDILIKEMLHYTKKFEKN